MKCLLKRNSTTDPSAFEIYDVDEITNKRTLLVKVSGPMSLTAAGIFISIQEGRRNTNFINVAMERIEES